MSCDKTGSYFEIDMNSLQTERYYKFVVKTTINGNQQIVDDNFYFKVVR